MIKGINRREYKKIQVDKKYKDEIMKFYHKGPTKKSLTRFLPVIPLVCVTIPNDNKDKTKWLTFDVKVRAGGTASSPSFKKMIVPLTLEHLKSGST